MDDCVRASKGNPHMPSRIPLRRRSAWRAADANCLCLNQSGSSHSCPMRSPRSSVSTFSSFTAASSNVSGTSATDRVGSSGGTDLSTLLGVVVVSPDFYGASAIDGVSSVGEPDLSTSLGISVAALGLSRASVTFSHLLTEFCTSCCPVLRRPCEHPRQVRTCNHTSFINVLQKKRR